nr:hypothetical protein [uncultured bacterium]
MFDFFMESILLSFVLGAIVGAIVTPHLGRIGRPRREAHHSAGQRDEDTFIRLRARK